MFLPTGFRMLCVTGVLIGALLGAAIALMAERHVWVMATLFILVLLFWSLLHWLGPDQAAMEKFYENDRERLQRKREQLDRRLEELR